MSCAGGWHGSLWSITAIGAAVDFGVALASGDAGGIALGAVDALGGKYLKALSRARGTAKALRGGRAAGKLAGQIHHAISKRVWEALQENRATQGIYKYRDRRFAAQAVDEEARKGYQSWHRALADQIADWIKRHEPTPDQFEAYLHWRCNESDLRARFPEGLMSAP